MIFCQGINREKGKAVLHRTSMKVKAICVVVSALSFFSFFKVPCKGSQLTLR